MPWICEACQTVATDDQQACPGCDRAKPSWTVAPDRTRTMVIGAQARLECLTGAGQPTLGAPPPGFATIPAQACPATPRAALAALAGAPPAPEATLIVRLWPRPRQDRTVTITVERCDGARDVTFPPEAQVERGDGSFDLLLAPAFGPGPALAPEALGGRHLLDVSDEDAGGVPAWAPSIEVAALRKRADLPIAPVAADDRRRRVCMIEVEDVSFGTGRKVFLPGAWSFADAATGLAVVGAVLTQVRRAPDLRVLVAGHTDHVGTDAANDLLSARRAENVWLYLTGQREAWARHCQEHYEIRDIEAVLAWVAFAHGWDTDPGEIDGTWGPKDKKARDAFRARYEAEHERKLPAGKQTAADWEACFDLYDRALADRLDTTVERLADLRAALRLTEPPTLACGERWPTRRPDVNPQAKAPNRRVDVLLFPPDLVPDLTATPPGAAVYGDEALERTWLHVDDALRDPDNAPYAEQPLARDCDIRPTHVDAPDDDAPSDEAALAAAGAGSPFYGD